MEIKLREVREEDWDYILELRNHFFKDDFVEQQNVLTKKEHYDYIILYADKASPIDKLIKKTKTTSIPIILYTEKTSDHSEQIKELMSSVPHVITGLFSKLNKNYDDLLKMIHDIVDIDENKKGD